MTPPFAPGFESRLDRFLGYVGEVMPRRDQRASFATYALGLLSNAERKSIEPLAARARPDAPDAAHQSLQHFIANAPWSDRAVRRRAAAWALWAATAYSTPRVSIIDDTGLLKQGSHSVGVQRQYTGSAGKITNCQVAVTLAVATDHDTVPIDVALYLPESWTRDAERRRATRVPDDVTFRTKGEIAAQLLRDAHADGVPLGDVLLADADYGRHAALRQLANELGMNYAVGVHRSQPVWDRGGVWTAPMSAGELASYLPGTRYRRLSWRDATNGRPLSARFAFERVYVTTEGREPRRGRDRLVWLVIEWRDGEDEPSHFYLSDLPHGTPRKRLVRTIKERWRTERLYEDLKGEVGFDHFEGRSWPGWHHHMSVVLCAYAVLVAERVMAFSPSPSRRPSRRPIGLAA